MDAVILRVGAGVANITLYGVGVMSGDAVSVTPEIPARAGVKGSLEGSCVLGRSLARYVYGGTCLCLSWKVMVSCRHAVGGGMW